MSDIRRMGRPECDEVLNELEEVKGNRATKAEVLSALTVESKRHAEACADCRASIEDFVELQEALEPMRASVLEPGPWFATRVMAAVKSTENEIEERKEGVWVGVRRLAPRLAAFAALLLVLGGTWAMELRRRDVASGEARVRQAEGLFETGSNAPQNDDIVATATEGTRP